MPLGDGMQARAGAARQNDALALLRQNTVPLIGAAFPTTSSPGTATWPLSIERRLRGARPRTRAGTTYRVRAGGHSWRSSLPGS